MAQASSPGSALLRRFRDLFQSQPKPIQAYIVTNHDPHMSEYLADADKRLRYITGFTGSSGTAVVTESEACLWTDARYFIQASNQLSPEWTLMKMGLPSTPTEGAWLSQNLGKGSRVGVDPKTIPYSSALAIQRELENRGHTLVPISENLVESVWEDRPPLPCNPVKPHPLKYSGKPSCDKIEEVRKKLKEKNVEMLLVHSLDEIAWLLNLRGSDISYNPVFYSFLVLTADEIHLFIDERKLTLEVRNHFNSEEIPISLHSYDSIYSYLTNQMNNVSKIWICSEASFELYSLIGEKQRFCECSPISLLKAVKNDVEVKGMANAHVKDAVALCRYFSWLEKEIQISKVTEISGAEKLGEFRKDEEDYVGPSFQTISASGLHAALAHYTPSEESDKEVTAEEIYLNDSGGQYLDGTTDVTRTFHFGTPTNFQRECFTRVFQGQASLGTAVFPEKIKGNYLDSFARKALWDVGLDYGHGTGHGIGSYLYVHEGPMGISWKIHPDDPGLQPNMYLSNEPGFYEKGKFGIRLEDIVQVVPAKTQYNLTGKQFLTFNTITLVPIQTKMLIPSLLRKEEVRHINSYHQRVRDVIGPILRERGYNDTFQWLMKETEPIEL